MDIRVFWYAVSGKYDGFIVELFLSGTQITSAQPEKESTSINKSPTPVMYAWSICTRLRGSTSLGHECRVVYIKFLNSLHFLHLLYILWHLGNIPTIMLLILSFFVWPQLHSVYHHVHFLSPIFFVFWGKLSDLHYKSLHILSLTYVLFLCKIFPFWNNFLICFLSVILLSNGSCLVFTAILSKDKTSVSTQCNKCIFKFLFYVLTPCKITILIVHLYVELNFLWYILYQSQMPLILLSILVFPMSWLWVILFLNWI